MENFSEWLQREEVEHIQSFNEDRSRYSVEINYRTNVKEVLDHFAKLVLGYVSAAMKNYNYHIKHVFSEKPFRIIVSTKNWQDGEWVGVVAYNDQLNCFTISKGYYNKLRRTASVKETNKCAGISASEIAKELVDLMRDLEKSPPAKPPKLKPAKKKRGPKK